MKKQENQNILLKLKMSKKNIFLKILLSIILGYLKQYAETSIQGKPIKNVIITVPANFENN